MKKKIFILIILVLGIIIFSTDFSSPDNFSSITFKIMLLISLVIFLISLFFSGIAYIEGRSKPKDYSNDKSYLVKLLIVFTGVTITFFYFLSISNWVIGLFIKVVGALLVSDSGSKRGRSSFLWFVLGFIEFNSAIIALILNSDIINIRMLNSKNSEFEYNTQFSNLNDLYKENIISKVEYKKMKQEIEATIIKKENNRLEEDNKEKENLIFKITSAYELGMFSKKDYEDKVQEIENKFKN